MLEQEWVRLASDRPFKLLPDELRPKDRPFIGEADAHEQFDTDDSSQFHDSHVDANVQSFVFSGNLKPTAPHAPVAKKLRTMEKSMAVIIQESRQFYMEPSGYASLLFEVSRAQKEAHKAEKRGTQG